MATKKIPLIPLKDITVFPNMIISFSVARQRSIDALESAMASDEIVYLITQKNKNVDWPVLDDLYKTGTISKVKQILRLPDSVYVIIEGINRGRIKDIIKENECDYASVSEVNKFGFDNKEVELNALIRKTTEVYYEYKDLVPKSLKSEGIFTNSITTEDPDKLSDIISSEVYFNHDRKQELLSIINPVKRLNKLLEILGHEVEVLKFKKSIDEKIKKSIDNAQKEYYLREQLKVIRSELGDKDGIQALIESYKERLILKKLPVDNNNKVLKEIERLEKIPAVSPENNVVKTYIDYILDMPWTEKSEENLSIQNARKVLDKEHYGLLDVKERVLEFLAVRKKVPEANATILCLVGPPGVGKTSIVKSIASALNRNYVRMSLGGIKDEAEIRGHRKTYIGAMPGRIINAVKQAKTINPLILLDEIDKLGVSYNGDPSSALLEVLDAEQNFAFRDHYIEMPYDLSKVLFLCTANYLEKIPAPLRDRMEIVNLSSYTSEEKKEIACKHLYLKQLKKHGLTRDILKITKDTFDMIIAGYTKEAGVREIEREIAKICRKVVKDATDCESKRVVINNKNLKDYLGAVKYKKSTVCKKSYPGIVTGLAWTSIGGETLQIEVNTMRGTGKVELTGNMGKVMKESAVAAISFIRANAKGIKVDENFYKDIDIHIHIPEGAVPKDGPSAGITMATAIISALTNKVVKRDIAMTGEITIRGRVLPIGGLKEKAIAAKKSGVKHVIVPIDNKADVSEIPNAIKDGMEFIYVEKMMDVIKVAFN